MTIGDDAIAAVKRHPAVQDVRLVGSRATGAPTVLSDWDFAVATDDFHQAAPDMAVLVAPLHPIVQQWDPLSDTWCWMAILPGPVKLDFIFAEPHESEPQWRPRADNLTAIDAHFWDWVLWLAAKQTAEKTELVRGELDKLGWHILSPMGVESKPTTIEDALVSYLRARDRLERTFNVWVPRTLEHEIRPVLAGLSSTP